MFIELTDVDSIQTSVLINVESIQLIRKADAAGAGVCVTHTIAERTCSDSGTIREAGHPHTGHFKESYASVRRALASNGLVISVS